MLFSSKPIAFVRKTSIVSRNQQSLFKLVRNLLKEDKYVVMYARPAYHVFDVDERNNSKSQIKKGREMVGNVYLDIIVIESETLRPACAFRMDDNGDKDEKQWSKQTRNLVEAAKSAEFPLFVVPNAKSYSSAMIAAKLNRIVPVSLPSKKRADTATKNTQSDEEERNVEHKRRETNTFHKTKP